MADQSRRSRLPSVLSYDDGALLEPLSVAVHSVARAGMREGARCLVFGAGAVGLLCAAVTKIEHNSRVVIVDVDEGRVGFALEHGFADAGFVVIPKKGETVGQCLSIANELSSKIGQVCWPGGQSVGQFEHVFECTGVESCVQTSIYVSSSSYCSIVGTAAHVVIDNPKRWERRTRGNGYCYPDMAGRGDYRP